MVAFTKNSKTILSVDFHRSGTCKKICSYCYVTNMERIYKSYTDKIRRNNILAKGNGKQFAETLNTEYRKLSRSKAKDLQRLSKLPVRLYGSGDFIPEHFEFISNLNFRYYIISKNLTENSDLYIHKLLNLNNLTSLILSFDLDNLINYNKVSRFKRNKRVKYCFTGYADDYIEVRKDYKFNIFFNISKKQIERKKSARLAEACPCDSGKLAHAQSCSYCNKCHK